MLAARNSAARAGTAHALLTAGGKDVQWWDVSMVRYLGKKLVLGMNQIRYFALFRIALVDSDPAVFASAIRDLTVLSLFIFFVLYFSDALPSLDITRACKSRKNI